MQCAIVLRSALVVIQVSANVPVQFHLLPLFAVRLFNLISLLMHMTMREAMQQTVVDMDTSNHTLLPPNWIF